MATARAATKSRKGASRSATSTASSAKAGAKNADASPADWSPRDQEDAAGQSWGVFTCIDEKTRKVFLIVQGVGTRFKNDNEARAFVKAQSEAGDALATRALRAVFRSMAGDKARRK